MVTTSTFDREGFPQKSESWVNLEMTSHVARLAQILLAPSQHSNYFALTAILSTIEVWPSKGKTTCVAKTDVRRKDQQVLEFRFLQKYKIKQKWKLHSEAQCQMSPFPWTFWFAKKLRCLFAYMSGTIRVTTYDV